jgi:hypothetical protein
MSQKTSTDSWSRKHHLGVDFVIWRRDGAWFWFLVNSRRTGGMIGAASNKSQAMREACLSIEAILVLCPINHFTNALDLLENRIGGGGPDKRSFVFVVVRDIAVDTRHQFAHAPERAPADGLLGYQREPALDLIKPARISRRVVDVKSPMTYEPGFDPWMLVGGVIIGDQVHRQVVRNLPFKVVEKTEELLVPMTRPALRNDRTIQHIQGGE